MLGDFSFKKTAFLVILFSLNFMSPASASQCSTLFQEKNYKEALRFCLQEKQNFRLGYIYAQLDNCQKMTKHYKLSNEAGASGNLGLALLHGNRGCEKNVSEGVEYLKNAILGGNPGFGKTLGDHYISLRNYELAREYYKKALQVGPYDTDWRKERAEDSFRQLMRSLNLSEKIELFLNGKFQQKFICRIGADVSSKKFTDVMEELTKSDKKTRFIKKLCKVDQAYFLGLTFENGLGNKEDFREAYRLFVIAGKEGNTKAKSSRDRVRKNLSPEQVAQASCLADYGLEPNFANKWYCDW